MEQVSGNTSTPLASDSAPPNIKKVVGASMAGTVAEWYEFYIYGIASTLVFGHLFFPNAGTTLDGIIAAFATYAIGFIARPLGGLVFGYFGDKYGRKKLLQLSLFLVGASTFLMGCLPGYNSIGYMAPVLLIVLRFIQGFAVGGEWGGAILLVGEHSPNHQRGFWASFPQSAVSAGNILASLVILALSMILSNEDFLSWGWRVAFWLSTIIIFIGYWIRRSVEDAPIFQEALKQAEEKQDNSSNFKELVTTYPKRLASGLLLRLGENTSYYMIVVFTITFLTLKVGIEYKTVLMILLAANVFHFFTMLFSGYLSDKIGRKPTMMAGNIGLIIWVFFYFSAISTGNYGTIFVMMCIGLLFQAMAYAPESATLAELFPTKMRYLGVSFSYQFASILAGSMAPIICAYLFKTYDATLPIEIYIAIVSFISVLAVASLKESKGIDLKDVK